MSISGKECARARESVSADLDRELQELDHRRLQAHLRVCADCSAWAERVQATTVQLREASLEPSPAPVFDRPRRGHRGRVGSAVVVASAAAVGLFAALGGQAFLVGRHSVATTALQRSPQPIAVVGRKVFTQAELLGSDSMYTSAAQLTPQGTFRAT
jgi:anti-sigma factor RsiW